MSRVVKVTSPDGLILPTKRPGDREQFEARLVAAQAKVADADSQAASARAERDALVAEAVEAGLSKYRVAQVLGVSQHAVTLMLGRS